MATTEPVQTKCGLCEQPVVGEALEAAVAGDLLLYSDWFGDGVVHPPEDFPAPKPWVSHGNRWIRQADGKVVHECGSFGRP